MKLLKPLYLIVTLWIFIFSCCEDSIVSNGPSSTEEWVEIAFDGKISDRNDGAIMSKSIEKKEKSKNAIDLSIGFNQNKEIQTKAEPLSYSARYLFFDTSGKCLYYSDIFTITPTNNKFRVPAKIPEGKSGKIYLFLSITENDLFELTTVTTESDLTKIWTTYNSLAASDNIPLSGYVTYTAGQKNLPFTVSHTGTKLSFNYTVQSYADFQPEQIVIGNVLGRNYLFNSNNGNVSNTTSLNSYTTQNNNLKGTLTYYIPENIQLTNNLIQNPWDKTSKNAPACATYIEIKGRCISKGLPAKIRIYPGANGTSDFNLKRNGSYIINLDMYFLDPEDPRVTIGEEQPVLIFDVKNMPQVITSFEYSNIPGYQLTQPKRVYIVEKTNRIGHKISEIKINEKKGKTFYTSIFIQPGTNYYTIDWNYNGIGGGTEDDPYLVATKDNLNEVRNHLDSHFLQVENIELSNTWSNFISIGNSSNPFQGVYDGNKLRIGTLLTANQIENSIYGYISGAEIKNVYLDVQSYYSYTYPNITGYITSNANKSIISDCEISGSITNSGENSTMGSIVGIGYNCTLLRNKLNGAITISGSNNYVGGIIGYGYKCHIENNMISNTASITNGTGNRIGAISGISEGSIFLNNIFDRQRYPNESGLVQP